jgi:phosphopantetheine adenylyltransferase
MMPSESYSYISSKLIKEAAELGAGLKDFVPPFVEKALAVKIRPARNGARRRQK